MKKLISDFLLLTAVITGMTSCTKDDVTPIAAPAATSTVSSHSATVTWNPVPGASSYIYRLDGAQGIMTTSTSVILEGLVSETEYTLFVKS